MADPAHSIDSSDCFAKLNCVVCNEDFAPASAYDGSGRCKASDASDNNHGCFHAICSVCQLQRNTVAATDNVLDLLLSESPKNIPVDVTTLEAAWNDQGVPRPEKCPVCCGRRRDPCRHKQLCRFSCSHAGCKFTLHAVPHENMYHCTESVLRLVCPDSEKRAEELSDGFPRRSDLTRAMQQHGKQCLFRPGVREKLTTPSLIQTIMSSVARKLAMTDYDRAADQLTIAELNTELLKTQEQLNEAKRKADDLENTLARSRHSKRARRNAVVHIGRADTIEIGAD